MKTKRLSENAFFSWMSGTFWLVVICFFGACRCAYLKHQFDEGFRLRVVTVWLTQQVGINLTITNAPVSYEFMTNYIPYHE